MGFYGRVISNPETRRPLKRIARKFNQMTVILTSRKGIGGIRNDSRVNLEGSTNLKKANWGGFRNHLFLNQATDTPKAIENREDMLRLGTQDS